MIPLPLKFEKEIIKVFYFDLFINDDFVENMISKN